MSSYEWFSQHSPEGLLLSVSLPQKPQGGDHIRHVLLHFLTRHRPGMKHVPNKHLLKESRRESAVVWEGVCWLQGGNKTR